MLAIKPAMTMLNGHREAAPRRLGQMIRFCRAKQTQKKGGTMSLPRVSATLFGSRGFHHALQFCHTCNESSGGPEEFAQRQLATDANIVLRHRKLVVD